MRLTELTFKLKKLAFNGKLKILLSFSNFEHVFPEKKKPKQIMKTEALDYKLFLLSFMNKNIISILVV